MCAHIGKKYQYKLRGGKKRVEGRGVEEDARSIKGKKKTGHPMAKKY